MKIGTLQLANPVILAPMAGITDLPYRLIMKRYGAALVFTEMVSANGLYYSGTGTSELLRTAAAERPLGVQLFGDDPQRLADAARQVEEVADLIDLNCGCSVPKVLKSGCGAALLRDLDPDPAAGDHERGAAEEGPRREAQFRIRFVDGDMFFNTAQHA